MNAWKIELNAAAKTGDRILILPLGEINGVDGRSWTLPEADASRLLKIIDGNGLDIVLDYDHGAVTGSSRAAGWLRNFRVEASGITAELEFTEAGQAAVAAKEYRYLSPAFEAKGKRILRLHSVALVNTPNLTELPALNSQQQGVDMDPKELAKLLGLPEDKPLDLGKALGDLAANHAKFGEVVESLAAKVDALASLGKGKDEDKKDTPDGLATLAATVGKLAETVNGLVSGGKAQKVAELVENAIKTGKLSPAQREAALKAGEASIEALGAMIEASPLDLKLLSSLQANAAKPQGSPEAKLSDVELATCAAMGIKPEDFVKSKEEIDGAC